VRELAKSNALHYLIRGISILAFGFTYSGVVSTRLSLELANGPLRNIVGRAVLWSLIFLPILLTAEVVVWWRIKGEHRAMWVDFLFVGVWYMAFIGAMLFTASHHFTF
jgi:hypothetical protein